MDWLGTLFDWQIFGEMAGKITAAYLLALPIGWEREQVQHSVGIRTFPLVATASCGYVLLADTFIGAHLTGVDAAARSRIIQGLTTGIGFIGGGAIMRGRGNVHGTATAASIWNTGAIGAAVAESHFEIAIIMSLLNLITLRLLLPLKERADRARQKALD
jgi:putative Mg2+ transporter-C (MgtC) family protein